MGDRWEGPAHPVDKWETRVGASVKSCGPEQPEWKTSETSVKSCRVGDGWEGPACPEWETSVGDKRTSGGQDKMMRLEHRE